jgi:epoxyqueuosine reductase
MSQNAFVPDPEQMMLWPDVSGNDINGLNNPNPSNPKYVYWGNSPEDVAFGALQRWFYSVDPGLPEYATERENRAKILAAPLKDVAAQKAEMTDPMARIFFESAIKNKIFDKAGVARFDPLWAFEGVEIKFRYIIVLGVQHDYDAISEAPKPEAGLEVMRQYSRAAFGAKSVANWLRGLGWDAEPLTGPMSGKVTLIPPALASGFGELGKHGSIINPEFGASFRLSGVLTDCPLPLDEPADHGIDDFCQNCRICEVACPPDALFSEKKMVRGTTKWYVDFDKCLPFFNEHQGCAICIAQCPWSRPGVGVNLAKKLHRRKQRKS